MTFPDNIIYTSVFAISKLTIASVNNAVSLKKTCFAFLNM